jgi:ATP-grasp domain, R2K clade family 3
MLSVSVDSLDIFQLEASVWVAQADTGLSVYDFPFDRFFSCRRPLYRPQEVCAIGRFGVTTDYERLYAELQARGVSLIHSPPQYLLASELTHWYNHIEDLTPRSVWFDQPPPRPTIEELFQWPVFIKGSRQTNRHQAELSIVRSGDEYDRVAQLYQANSILNWQPFVCREFVPLREVKGSTGDKVPPRYEFRTFWWKGECVGAGPYWACFANYDWTPSEKLEALSLAEEVARRVSVTFLVVDVAQTADGRWLVIECNDGQESGYAGVAPIALWNNIIAAESHSL